MEKDVVTKWNIINAPVSSFIFFVSFSFVSQSSSQWEFLTRSQYLYKDPLYASFCFILCCILSLDIPAGLATCLLTTFNRCPPGFHRCESTMASRSIFQKLFFVCLLSSAAPSTTALAMAVTTAHSADLLQRDAGSCPDSTFNRCHDTKLPSNFCCPKSSTCISLDDSTSALCCPDGECALIQPIVCDVSLQNAATNPKNPLMTTKLDKDLPKCGDLCCPHGYSCQDGKTCRKDEATSTTSSASTSSTQTTQTASALSSTSTKEATATATSTLFLFPTSASGMNETSASLNADCPSFPGRAVVAGFFPGLITGVLITLITIICIGRRRQKQQPQQTYSSKSGHFRNRSSDGAIIGISDPMPGEIQNSVRTDFLRQPSYDGGASASQTKSRFYRTGSRVKGLFNGSPKPNYTPHAYRTSTPPPIPPIYRPTPSTPPDHVHPQRQPSTESIKVYSPEHIVRGHGSLRPDWMRPNNNNNNNTRPTTTFTEMMERVGFQSSNGSPHFKVTVTPPTRSPDSPRG